MKKTLLNNLKLIVIGLIIAVSASYAYAAWGGPLSNTYENPTGSPTAGNTETPLNTSALNQIKPIGACSAGNCGGLALGGTFLASKSAEFDGTTFLNGIVGGGSDGLFPASSMLYFGFSGNPTPITVSGALTTNSSFKSDLLANADGTRTLCSDENGVVGFCNIVDMCTNISGNQETVPTGYVQNPGGTCGKAPKRFYSVTHDQFYDSKANGVLVGDVKDGNITDHVPYVVPNGTTVLIMPLVAQIGLYNGSTSCGTAYDCPEWVHNDIPNITHTGLTSSLTSLFDQGGVGESGTYHFKISTSGTFGIAGKFDTDDNRLAVDFYMKVNNQWIRLYDKTAKDYAHEEYPVPGKLSADFFGFFASDSDSLYRNGKGDQFHYVPYSINFDQTMHLNRGDAVNIYAFIYGDSFYSNFNADGYNNFYYSVDQQGAIFDITETPD